ncbi:MAG: DUF3299 domain-containing protein [Limnohabitans sp.]
MDPPEQTLPMTALNPFPRYRQLAAHGVCCALLVWAGALQAQTVRETVPSMGPSLSPASAAAPVAAGARTITWERLMPPGWDPFKDIKAESLQVLDDADPRAAALLKRMREAWDKAPVNPAVVGQQVRLPGYVVPLEERPEGLKEFLLVPYFGACIHSPPPPANQIVHVLLDKPVKGFRSMDTVWITGLLAADRTDSFMGAAGYRMKSPAVSRYTER